VIEVTRGSEIQIEIEGERGREMYIMRDRGREGGREGKRERGREKEREREREGD